MDSKTRNLTLLLVFSLFCLAIGLVVYSNREMAPSVSGNETMDGNKFVNGDKLDNDSLHAFLKDETFFDYEEYKPSTIKTETANTNTLYMIATSSEHDIKIAVTDVFGHPVTGNEFYVTVEGQGEYKDLNQDGIINVPDLNAGDYYLSLAEVEGYKIPSEPMRVSVKDKLEFKVIEDISYYIFSEDMVDFAKEDTEEQISTEDYDDTGSSEAKYDPEGIFGIDVSRYQKDIDWEMVAAEGVKFAIIRCGYRGSKSGVLVEDPYFRKNIEGAKQAGIKVGVYFFTQAISETEAVEEASMVAKLCSEYELDYPVFIDTESAGGRADTLDKELRTNIIDAFCKTVKGAGYNPGVYASRCWFQEKLDDSRLQNYVLWDAEYRSEPLYEGNYKIWQYSSNGTLRGIPARVDLDISYTEF